MEVIEQRDTAVAREFAFQSEIMSDNSLNLAVLLAVESVKKKDTLAGREIYRIPVMDGEFIIEGILRAGLQEEVCIQFRILEKACRF